MKEHNYKRRRFKNGTPLWFFVAVLLAYKFKSFRKFLIYLLHYSSIIDLRERRSEEISNKEIVFYIEQMFPEKIPRKLLREATNLKSGNTFNDKLKPYLEKNNFMGRRSFTLTEAFGILQYWQGNGQWGRLSAAKKEFISEILHNGNYERTAIDFKGAVGKDKYQENLISPKKIKKLIAHIDLTEEELVEDLKGYEEFESWILWVFGIMMISLYLDKNNTKISIPKDPRKPISLLPHTDT